jgi:hypothetical protein
MRMKIVMKKSEILTTLIDNFFSFDAEMGNHEEYSMDEFIGLILNTAILKVIFQF